MHTKAGYFLLQCLLTLISPILSFVVSLRLYKNGISQVFLLVFAFFFGFFCRHFYDESVHFYEMQAYYAGYSLSEILNNPLVFAHGHDLFHFIVKFLVSRFSTDEQVFGGILCLLHFSLFLFFFRQLKPFYSKYVSFSSGMMLIIFCLVVEFWWFSNLRFCSATFYFGGFYLKYCNSRKIQYLLLSLLSPLFHFTFLAIDAVVLLNFILTYCHKSFRYILLLFSLFVRSLNIDFAPFLIKHVSWLRENMSYAIVNTETRQGVLNYMKDFRQNGNIVYNSRPYILLFLGLFVLFIFKRLKIEKDEQYSALFYMFLTIFTVANFGYGDMFFYNRMTMISLLFLWAYIFIINVKYYPLSKKANLLLSCVLFLPMLFFLITPIVQFRHAILQPELWFGNFFMDWNGNNLDLDYATFKRS